MPEPPFTRTREQIAADNRAEIDGWIDERAAELVASGIDPAEARRCAISEFGDVGEAQRYAVRQDVAMDRRIRAALWIEEFGSDVRIAIRTLSRAPLVTGVVLLAFALGIGAATAVFSVVHAMLLRPLPYGDENTLVQLQPVENGVIRPAARYSAAALVALRERTTSFTGIAGIESGNIVITENGEPEQLMVSAFTPDGFDVLRVPRGDRAHIRSARGVRTHQSSGGASGRTLATAVRCRPEHRGPHNRPRRRPARGDWRHAAGVSRADL